jgi:hypothetical protein
MDKRGPQLLQLLLMDLSSLTETHDESSLQPYQLKEIVPTADIEEFDEGGSD